MNKKILIIESDMLVADNLIKKIEMHGFLTKLVLDETSTLPIMKSFRPDLVLIDTSASARNFQKALTAISSDDEMKLIPVISISASEKTDAIVDKVKKKLGLNEDVTLNAAPLLADKKILWIEDDKFFGKIIEKKLLPQQCKLTLVTTGADAWDYLKTITPDIIILDLLLPDIDGFELLQTIKAGDKKDIPVVVVSNSTQQSDIARATKLQAAEFIIKASMTIDEILYRISKHL